MIKQSNKELKELQEDNDVIILENGALQIKCDDLEKLVKINISKLNKLDIKYNSLQCDYNVSN